jgi:hypothetical protein
MANGHGGYRRPANPAVVSGPGAHSKRTDGAQPKMDLPNAQYGENAAFQEMQSGAAMAQGSGASAPPAGDMGAPMLPGGLTGMGAPSEQPDVPVTAGAAAGAGPGMDALGQAIPPDKADATYLKKYLPTFIAMAERDDTPPSMKTWVRNIIANL